MLVAMAQHTKRRHDTASAAAAAAIEDGRLMPRRIQAKLDEAKEKQSFKCITKFTKDKPFKKTQSGRVQFEVCRKISLRKHGGFSVAENFKPTNISFSLPPRVSTLYSHALHLPVDGRNRSGRLASVLERERGVLRLRRARRERFSGQSSPSIRHYR